MRTGVVCAAIVAVVALGLAGCHKKEPAPPAQPGAQQGGGTSLQDVEKKTGEAAQAAGQYLAQEKDKVVASATKELDQLEKEVKDLEASAAKGEPAKTDYEKVKPQLDHQVAEAKARLEEAKKAGAQAWESTKAGLDKAMAGLQDAYKDAKAKVESQPAQQPQPDSGPK